MPAPRDPMADIPAIIARGEIKIFTIFPDHDAPAFAYTVGMTDRGQPELVMSGFPLDLMGNLIFAASKRTEPFLDGDQLDDIASCPLICRVFPAWAEACQPLIFARRYYGRLVPVCQIVCPDPDGRFPWDRGCEPTYASIQSHFGDLTVGPGFAGHPMATSRQQ